MAEVVLVVVSTVVEGLAATTEGMEDIAEGTGATGEGMEDSAGRVEWAAGLSAARADIPGWGAVSPVEEPGLATERHPMRASLTASGTASAASLEERVSEPATLHLLEDGVEAMEDGVEAGAIPAGVGAAGDWASVGDWDGGVLVGVGAGVGVRSGIGRRTDITPGDLGTGIPGTFTIILTEVCGSRPLLPVAGRHPSRVLCGRVVF